MDALTQIQASEPALAVYQALGRHLDTLGPHEIEVKKTSLHVSRGRAFLGIHPRKNGLLLNFVLTSPLAGERVRKREQVSRNRWHNEVLVTGAHDLDAELIDWLGEAYRLTQGVSKP